MVDQYLRRRALTAPPVPSGEHLDEDALAVFVEGRLSEAESAPLISHLVDCGLCRLATSQLIRLESEFGEVNIAQPVGADAPEPGRIRRLLEGLAARVIPQSDEESVFAYHAPAEDFRKSDEEKAGEESAAEGDDAKEQAD
jgi:hypothetical protein